MIEFAPGLSGVRVALEGKFVGIIKQVEGGWQYFPKGHSKFGGDIYPTLLACQKSLGEKI